jgi:hypothetical protein
VFAAGYGVRDVATPNLRKNEHQKKPRHEVLTSESDARSECKLTSPTRKGVAGIMALPGPVIVPDPEN